MWPLVVRSQPTHFCRDLADARNCIDALEAAAANEILAGYIGYDLGGAFESLPQIAADDLHLPLLAFAPPQVMPILQSQDLRQVPDIPLRSTFTREGYMAAVQRVLEYISAGDVFQVNLSQRITVAARQAPIDLIWHICRDSPAPYNALLDFHDFQIISNSPELFFRIERLPRGRRRIVNRPIKGTRPRMPGMREELERSEKDRAELAMIVDLQRNDLGRICEVGSVKVDDPRTIEETPRLYHGVATISGILRADVTLADILRAIFPCGSVTGCPKIRAMQIIDELEPVRRGPYCGAIGWIGPGGAMEFAVAIRTIVIKDGLAHLNVGGGIVADSTAAAEYDETLVKAAALLAALGHPLAAAYS